MVLVHELSPAQPDRVGSAQQFDDEGVQRTPFFLSGYRASDLDAYVRDVAESSCDPGARRALQILHGLGACVGGDALLLDVCDDIANRMGYNPDEHELIIV